MIEKIAECEKRFEYIEQELSSPEVTGDLEAYKNYMKEYKSLTPIVEKYREYKKALADIADAESLLESETDQDMRDLAEEERLALLKALEAAESGMGEGDMGMWELAEVMAVSGTLEEELSAVTVTQRWIETLLLYDRLRPVAQLRRRACADRPADRSQRRRDKSLRDEVLGRAIRLVGGGA